MVNPQNTLISNYSSVTSNQDCLTIINSLDTTSSLISINNTSQISIKPTSLNHTSWCFQFHVVLIGYDLMGFVDGSKPCPSPSITTINGNNLNLDYSLWIWQDQLILSVIAGSILPNLVSFIASTCTSREAWNILANNYTKPFQGWLTQLKKDLHFLTKGTQSIIDYMQSVKVITDELAMLNHPIDNEDFTLKILSGWLIFSIVQNTKSFT